MDVMACFQITPLLKENRKTKIYAVYANMHVARKFTLKNSYKITAKTELNESCYRCRGASDLQDKIIINGF